MHANNFPCNCDVGTDKKRRLYSICRLIRISITFKVLSNEQEIKLGETVEILKIKNYNKKYQMNICNHYFVSKKYFVTYYLLYYVVVNRSSV